MNYSKALVAVGVATLAASGAMAKSQFEVELNIGPPPVVYEAEPAPRAGYIWAPGYWDYQGNKHVWRKGRWERERHGQHWAGGQWSEHDGKWHLDRGHWERG